VKRAPLRFLLGPLVGLMMVLLLPSTAAAVVRFAVPGGGSPAGITIGPDGALWFTETGSDQIGRITTEGQIQEFSIPAGSSPAEPDDIVAGPDGRLWFTEPGRNRIGAITTSGVLSQYGPTKGPPDGIACGPGCGPGAAIWFTEFDPPAPDGTGPKSWLGWMGANGTIVNEHALPTDTAPSDITAGPDGRLWFTETGRNQLGTITTSGILGEKHSTGLEPGAITPGPGSTLWFTETGDSKIGRLATTSGAISHFGPTGSGPSGITIGPDDALWFSQFDDPAGGGSGASAVGRVTFQGAITNVVLSSGSHPDGITAGPAGRREIWFTEFGANNIARIDLPPPFVPPAPPPPIGTATAPPPKKSSRPACVVPKVRGLSVKRARKKLKRARCRYRVSGRGRVVSTSPRAGKRTRKIVQVRAKRRLRKAGKATASAGAIRPSVQ
jgi:virginiamycin B lyase